MSRHRHLVPLLAPILAFGLSSISLAGCGDEAAAPEPVEDELATFYDTLRADAEDFAYDEGEWTEDFGDANFYGLAFYVRAGLEIDDAVYLQRAREVRDYNLTVLERANTDTEWLVDNLEEVLMSGLGLVEYAAATGETDFIDDLDTFIDHANSLVALLGDYVEEEIGAYAAATYGGTAITGGLALLNLQYATYLETERRQARIERAEEIVATIDERAFDGERYLFWPDEEKLFLYPNSIMILVLCRLYELTGEQAYLDQAEQAFAGVESLRNTEHGYYRSPYSAVDMGAQTDDYSTLSSQNYFTLALLLLHQNTSEAVYLERARQILDWLRSTLYDPEQGRILHHWIDGHIAHPDDPEYFCSGCNLQYLYVVWYLQSVVGG